jgi:hypothetical protein
MIYKVRCYVTVSILMFLSVSQVQILPSAPVTVLQIHTPHWHPTCSMTKKQNTPLLISPSSEPMGVEGVAGTDEALRRRLALRKLRLIAGSSLRSGPTSSKISRSTRPEYRNFEPHEKKLPPVTTDGASELDGNLYQTHPVPVINSNTHSPWLQFKYLSQSTTHRSNTTNTKYMPSDRILSHSNPPRTWLQYGPILMLSFQTLLSSKLPLFKRF